MMKLHQATHLFATAMRNIVLGGNLLSLSLIRKPRRMVEYLTECCFLYKSFNSKKGLPQKNVCEVLAAENIHEVKLGGLKSEEIWGSGWHLVDLISLSLICQIIKPKVVFEIGTMRGYFTSHFALNTADDARVYTLDLPKDGSEKPQLKTNAKDEASIRQHSSAESYCFSNEQSITSKVTCLFGDSATFDFSPYHDGVDLFFIDGAHSKEYVESDTRNAFKCCHPGSVIAWHDYGNCGVNDHSGWIRNLANEHEIFVVPNGSIAYMVVKES